MIFKNEEISKQLSEIIDKDDIDIKSLSMKPELNPLFWDNEALKSDVRKTMLLNAKRFIEFCDLEQYKFDDIILTGSIANYNYNNNSDVDIHIIMDYSQINPDKEFVTAYFKLKKMLWAEKLPIQIKGSDVEMYIQDNSESHSSTGIYSLVRDKWIIKPTKKIINIDTNSLKIKLNQILEKIYELEGIENNDEFLKKYDNLITKIKNYRKCGLDKEGEYSLENLIFKILRNSKYLDNLLKLKNNRLTKELSLKQ